MIRLFVYDIKHNKKFVLDKDYDNTIKIFKKYARSNNIYCMEYYVYGSYSSDLLSQLSYWYSRQYRLLK